jgi:hypothetical protein
MSMVGRTGEIYLNCSSVFQEGIHVPAEDNQKAYQGRAPHFQYPFHAWNPSLHLNAPYQPLRVHPRIPSGVIRRIHCTSRRSVPETHFADHLTNPQVPTKIPVLPYCKLYMNCATIRIYARGWKDAWTSLRNSRSTCVYICVVVISSCPSISCTDLRSAPPSRRCVAKE